jgi:hypothetical protein
MAGSWVKMGKWFVNTPMTMMKGIKMEIRIKYNL